MSEHDEPSEEIDIALRPAEVVARRFIIVNSVVQRIVLDASPEGDVYGSAFDLREWLRNEGLWDETTREERAILTPPPGAFGPDILADLGLHAEGLATLAWALSLIERPLPDDLSQLLAREDAVPMPWAKIAPWVSTQALRPEALIALARELAELWSWRYEIEPIRRMAEGRELMEVERTIREVTHEASAAGLLEPGKKGGFTVRGTPVTRMDPIEIEEMAALQTERLMALNWICGYGEDWDSVPLEI
jgi:hypothetical protein